jgi:O-antigen/teichoic acid export membrane protein
MGGATSASKSPATNPDWRFRQMGTGAGALIAARIVAALCGMVQLPIVLAALGVEGLGVWLVLMGLLWSLAILDFGLGAAAQNQVTALIAEGRRSEAAAVLGRTRRQLLLVAGGVVIVGLPLALAGPWSEWLGITNPALEAATPAAVTIVLIAAAVAVPWSLASRTAAALQQTWIIGLWTMAGSVLGLGAIIVAARLQWTLAGFVAAGCILPVAPHVGTWLTLRRRESWLRSAGEVPPAASDAWRGGIFFFLPELGATILGAFVPLLVAIFAGPVGAAAFSVLQRLYGFAVQVQMTGLAATWPAYANAAATQDGDFARRTFRATWWITALGFVTPTLLLTPLMPTVVRWWLGADAPAIEPSLLWIMAAWHVLQFCGRPIAILLHGLGRMRGLTAAGWIGIAGALPLCAILGPRWGAAGVVVALAAPYLCLSLPITAWQAHQALAEISAGRSRKP